MYRSGFSIIEVLVVIGIISVLAVVPTMYFLSIQSDARDVRRQQDLADVATALQQYRQETGEYPDSPSYQGLSFFLVPGFINNLPRDPFEGREVPDGAQGSVYQYTYEPRVSDDSGKVIDFSLGTTMEERSEDGSPQYLFFTSQGKTLTEVIPEESPTGPTPSPPDWITVPTSAP